MHFKQIFHIKKSSLLRISHLVKLLYDSSLLSIRPMLIIREKQMEVLHDYMRKQFEDIVKAMRLVAVDRETQLEFTGKILPSRPRLPIVKKPELTREQIAHMATGGYFNSDLVEQVRLPERPGSYDVHAELGERDTEDFLTSNIVNIVIAEE